MPVRHCWPPGSLNSRARLRTAFGPSGIIGKPPASAKRPITGTRPDAKTLAVDSRAAAPLPSNQPLRQTPLAWFRRKPGCGPFTASNRSIMRAGSRRPGENHPAVAAKAAAIASTATPIPARRTSAAGRVRAARP
jgi:hypothetical protein